MTTGAIANGTKTSGAHPTTELRNSGVLPAEQRDSTSDDSAPPPAAATGVLDYGRPAGGGRYRVKHVLAVVFAVVALPLGAYFWLFAIERFSRAVTEPTTADRLSFQNDAVRLLACSIVLVVSGIWYLRIGLRGERAGGAASEGHA